MINNILNPMEIREVLLFELFKKRGNLEQEQISKKIDEIILDIDKNGLKEYLNQVIDVLSQDNTTQCINYISRMHPDARPKDLKIYRSWLDAVRDNYLTEKQDTQFG